MYIKTACNVSLWTSGKVSHLMEMKKLGMVFNALYDVFQDF